MTAELFPASAVTKDSPRLLWCKRHNLSLGQLPEGTKYCVGSIAVGFGTTLLEAEQDYCAATGEDHWEVEEFKRAGVKMPEKAEEW